MRSRLPLIALLAALVGGCDLLGIEGATTVAARREAEGKAIGGACRHAGRALEDCYAMNKKADKGAVFAGWREMNDYMRENKISEVVPQVVAATPKPVAKNEDEEEAVEPKPSAKKSKGG